MCCMLTSSTVRSCVCLACHAAMQELSTMHAGNTSNSIDPATFTGAASCPPTAPPPAPLPAPAPTYPVTAAQPPAAPPPKGSGTSGGTIAGTRLPLPLRHCSTTRATVCGGSALPPGCCDLQRLSAVIVCTTGQHVWSAHCRRAARWDQSSASIASEQSEAAVLLRLRWAVRSDE